MLGQWNSPSILIVGTSDFTRNFTTLALSTIGINNITDTDNGKSALATLSKQSIDLVLCDSCLPEISGFDLLKQVRATRQLAHIPFILLVADSCEEATTAIKLGATDIIFMPVRHGVLTQKVTQIL